MTGRTGRDPFVDALRALSLLVVVMWHWVFTVIIWEPDGPHASNPIGVTHGLWMLTWLLQVLPFRYHWPVVQWINLVVVWALPHQLGLAYERLVAAPRRFALGLASGGLIALFGLTNMGLYPRSMVGVPGETISNMAPPTLAI